MPAFRISTTASGTNWKSHIFGPSRPYEWSVFASESGPEPSGTTASLPSAKTLCARDHAQFGTGTGTPSVIEWLRMVWRGRDARNIVRFDLIFDVTCEEDWERSAWRLQQFVRIKYDRSDQVTQYLDQPFKIDAWRHMSSSRVTAG